MRIAERLQLLKLRRAMSLSKAKEILGFPPTASPSKGEIERNYRKLAIENHPDRGGDIEKMKMINVARDVLEGRQRPTWDDPAPSTSRPRQQPQPEPPPKSRPRTVVVTWAQAALDAKIPPNVTWLFATDRVMEKQEMGLASGCVVYGQTDNMHVFVGIERYMTRSSEDQPGHNVYKMETEIVPKKKGYKNFLVSIKFLFGLMPRIKGRFGGKIQVFPKPVTKFDPLALHVSGDMLPLVTLNEGLEQLRLISRVNRSTGIIFEITEYDDSKGRFDYGKLSVEGKPYPLTNNTLQFLASGYNYKLLNKIFGRYYARSGGRKDISKLKDKDAILSHLLRIFIHTHESALVDALRAIGVKP